MSNKSKNSSFYNRKQKTIVIVLFGVLAFTTVVGSIGGAFLSSDRTNADVAAETGAVSAATTTVTPSTLSNAAYIEDIKRDWQIGWDTAPEGQNASVCEMRASDPKQLEKLLVAPPDMPTTMTADFYYAELGKFFDDRCASDLPTPAPSWSLPAD